MKKSRKPIPQGGIIRPKLHTKSGFPTPAGQGLGDATKKRGGASEPKQKALVAPIIKSGATRKKPNPLVPKVKVDAGNGSELDAEGSTDDEKTEAEKEEPKDGEEEVAEQLAGVRSVS